MKGQFEKGKDDAWYLVISDKVSDIFESIKNQIVEKTWDPLEYDKDYILRVIIFFLQIKM